jgi:ornithine cyclodeaminase
MRALDADMTGNLLPYSPLAEALGGALRRWKSGAITAPPRLRLPLPGGGVLLVMPAAGERLAVAKLASVHPDNPARGLPTIVGEVVVLDAQTGERLALLDGPELTARRTAALSLLAARTLAPDPGGPLLLVGAGVQARGHLEAFAAGLGTRRAWVAGRTPARAEALAAHGRTLGMDCRVVALPGFMGVSSRPAEGRGAAGRVGVGAPQPGSAGGEFAAALALASLVVTATTSATPVLPPGLPGDGLRPDAFLAAVGAHSPAEAEIPAALVRRCRVYVDILDACRAEAGDLISAGVDWAEVTPLADALDQPRPQSGPILFKTVGHALFDLAAAELAVGSLG